MMEETFFDVRAAGEISFIKSTFLSSILLLPCNRAVRQAFLTVEDLLTTDY